MIFPNTNFTYDFCLGVCHFEFQQIIWPKIEARWDQIGPNAELCVIGVAEVLALASNMDHLWHSSAGPVLNVDGILWNYFIFCFTIFIIKIIRFEFLSKSFLAFVDCFKWCCVTPPFVSGAGKTLAIRCFSFSFFLNIFLIVAIDFVLINITISEKKDLKVGFSEYRVTKSQFVDNTGKIHLMHQQLFNILNANAINLVSIGNIINSLF